MESVDQLKLAEEEVASFLANVHNITKSMLTHTFSLAKIPVVLQVLVSSAGKMR